MFKIKDLIKEIEDIFEIQALHKKLLFSSQILPHVPVDVYQDRTKLGQVLVNII